MKRIIAAAALAVILATTAACGGDGGNGGEERLHPVIPNHIYLQIQEGREYVTLWGDVSRHALSDRINALYTDGLRNSAHHEKQTRQLCPHLQEDCQPGRIIILPQHDSRKLTFPVRPEQTTARS